MVVVLSPFISVTLMQGVIGLFHFLEVHVVVEHMEHFGRFIMQALVNFSEG